MSKKKIEAKQKTAFRVQKTIVFFRSETFFFLHKLVNIATVMFIDEETELLIR